MQLVLGEPPGGLRRPVLLAGFGGWGDAGSAASIALRHVLGDPAPPASAMLDPSACYDFTVARPLSTRSADGRRWSLEYPKVAFYPLPLPGADRDLLILLGPEPHFRWPELAPAIINYARAAGVESMITLGAYVGPVTRHAALPPGGEPGRGAGAARGHRQGDPLADGRRALARGRRQLSARRRGGPRGAPRTGRAAQGDARSGRGRNQRRGRARRSGPRPLARA